MQDHLYHQETVKYNLGFLWAMLLFTLVGTLGAAGYTYYLGASGWFAPLLVALMIVPLAIFFAVTELRLELRQDSFVAHYHPWGSYEYFREDIESITLEEYDAARLGEFNWLRDRMRIMGGQYCVRVKLKNGRSVFVTTRQARELREQLIAWLKAEEVPVAESLDLADLPPASERLRELEALRQQRR
ncbi:MAG: hypothetical protein AAFZ52_10750 [Bacteroidota bacterium]